MDGTLWVLDYIELVNWRMVSEVTIFEYGIILSIFLISILIETG